MNRILKLIKEKAYDNDDVYSFDGLNACEEEETITPIGAAFMRGYLEEEEGIS